MRRVLVLLGLFAFLAGAGCAKRGDPVQALLDGTVKDAEGRDAGALAARLTDDFRAADGEDRAAIEAMLRRIFLGYEHLSVTLSDVTIERSPEAAQVAFRADLSGSPRGAGLAAILPRSGAWRFEMRAVRDGETWKISTASWRPLEGAP